VCRLAAAATANFVLHLAALAADATPEGGRCDANNNGNNAVGLAAKWQSGKSYDLRGFHHKIYILSHKWAP